MKNFFRQFATDQRGLSTMEYSVLFVIIVVGAVALWGDLGEELAGQVTDGTTEFTRELVEHQP